MRGAYFSSDGSNINADWFYEAKDPVQPQYRIGEDGPWIDDVYKDYGDWSMWEFTKYGYFGITINVEDIDLYTDYYVRIKYEDKVSSILHIYITERNIIVDENAGGGDNDGGDRDDITPPDFVQPPPSNSDGTNNDDDTSDSDDDIRIDEDKDKDEPLVPSTEPVITPRNLSRIPLALAQTPELAMPTIPVSTLRTLPTLAPTAPSLAPVQPETNLSSAPPMEQVTATTTVMSGERLQYLLNINPDYLLFEKRGVAIELPRELLSDLLLTSYDQFEVHIELLDENNLQIIIMADDVPMADIPNTVLRLPWAGEEIPRLIHVDSEMEVTATLQDGILSATIDKTGNYTIESPKKVSVPTMATDVQPVDMTSKPMKTWGSMAIVSVVIFLGVIGLWFWIRRWGYGKKQ